jgi:hypothetical protein
MRHIFSMITGAVLFIGSLQMANAKVTYERPIVLAVTVEGTEAENLRNSLLAAGAVESSSVNDPTNVLLADRIFISYGPHGIKKLTFESSKKINGVVVNVVKRTLSDVDQNNAMNILNALLPIGGEKVRIP